MMTKMVGSVGLAEHPVVVLTAYAFLALFVLPAFLSPSDKWTSFRRMHIRCRCILLCQLSGVVTLMFYTILQLHSENFREGGFMIVILVVIYFHLIRTYTKIFALHMFWEWCRQAIQCLQAISEEGEIGEFHDIRNRLLVNEAMIRVKYSELEAKSITSIWHFMKYVDADFSHAWKSYLFSFVATKRPEVWTVRWSCAFLHSFLNEGMEYIFGASSCELTSFDLVAGCLRDVTFRDTESTITSISDNYSAENELELKEAAFGSIIPGFKTFQLYGFEFNGVKVSLPSDFTKSINFRDISIEIVDMLALAKHVGCDTLKLMNVNRKRNCFPSKETERRALYFLIMQCNDISISELVSKFRNMGDIPMFPYRLQMVPLWEKRTNFRVLQASAHKDIDSAIGIGELVTSLGAIQFEDVIDFDSCRNCAYSVHEDFPSASQFVSLGVTLETVRTMLAESLSSHEPYNEQNWVSTIHSEPFQFSLSSSLSKLFEAGDNYIRMKRRLVWEVQLALHSALVASSPSSDVNYNNKYLIMLFILSLPVLDVKIGEGRINNVTSKGSAEDVYAFGVDMSSIDVSIASPIGPQSLEIVVNVSCDHRRASVSIESDKEDCRFQWQPWVSSCMGWMKGVDDYLSSKKERSVERIITRPDLSMPIVEWTERRHNSEELYYGSGIIEFWSGWPPFDLRFCDFEVQTWLNACGICKYKEQNHETVLFDEEIKCAVKRLLAVIRGSRDFDSQFSMKKDVSKAAGPSVLDAIRNSVADYIEKIDTDQGIDNWDQGKTNSDTPIEITDVEFYRLIKKVENREIDNTLTSVTTYEPIVFSERFRAVVLAWGRFSIWCTEIDGDVVLFGLANCGNNGLIYVWNNGKSKSIPCVSLPEHGILFTALQQKLVDRFEHDCCVRAILAGCILSYQFEDPFACVLETLLPISFRQFSSAVHYDVPIDQDLMLVLADPYILEDGRLFFETAENRCAVVEKIRTNCVCHLTSIPKPAVRGMFVETPNNPLPILFGFSNFVNGDDTDAGHTRKVTNEPSDEGLIHKLHGIENAVNGPVFNILTMARNCSPNQHLDLYKVAYMIASETNNIIPGSEGKTMLPKTTSPSSKLFRWFGKSKKAGKKNKKGYSTLQSADKFRRRITGDIIIVGKDGLYKCSRFKNKALSGGLDINFIVVKFKMETKFDLIPEDVRITSLKDVAEYILGREYQPLFHADDHYPTFHPAEDGWSEEVAIANTLAFLICRQFGKLSENCEFASRNKQLARSCNNDKDEPYMMGNIFLPVLSIFAEPKQRKVLARIRSKVEPAVKPVGEEAKFTLRIHNYPYENTNSEESNTKSVFGPDCKYVIDRAFAQNQIIQDPTISNRDFKNTLETAIKKEGTEKIVVHADLTLDSN